MLCKKPYIPAGALAAYPCGQCLPCRINRRRLWTHRMILESYMHDQSCFVTFTYSPEFHPEGGSVNPYHLQLFWKRLRWLIRPHKIRYFAVGEYGDNTQRPHYHAVIFGIGIGYTHCISHAWHRGFVQVVPFTPELAQYCAGYVTKKMTKKSDPRLNGRYPEFARMSNKPGIGATAVNILSQSLLSKVGWDSIVKTGDVPTSLQHGLRKLPLGRYMRKKLREVMNFEETGGQQELIDKSAEEMLVMLESLKDDPKTPPAALYSLRAALNYKNAQKILNVETKYNIKNLGKKTL